MALVERLKRWRGLSRLRARTRRDPSPAAYGELAERLIALGEVDLAVRTADEGLQRFPDSERLAHVRLYAKKGRLAGQIRKLREDLLRRPNPLTYSQLAQIYRELGSPDEALAIAAECAERFPLNEAPYLIQGEIRMERFRRDLIAKDAVIAEGALKRVARLNSNNVSARLHLAELYWLVGLVSECRKNLRQVLSIMPAAKDVQEFLREMEDRADAPVEGGAFEDLVEKVAGDGDFANDPERFPNPAARGAARSAPKIDEEAIRADMSGFGAHVGVRNAALLEKNGVVVADFAGRESLARTQFAELVAGVRDTADDASRRMDTGALVRAEIEGPGGNITLVRVRGLTVAVLYSDPLRAEDVAKVLADFVARNLVPRREAASA